MKLKHKIGILVAGVVATATILVSQGGKAGPADLYPSPVHTPGVVNIAVTQATIGQTICVKGWTATIRPPASYTTSLKAQQLPIAAGKLSDYEEDHFISLELGGNPTSIENLWPEPYVSSVAGVGARTKDQVEDYLHRQVCSGAMTLAEAQKEITSDWYSVYVHTLQKQALGSIINSTSTISDPDDEQ